ncbi:putative acetyltransferase [Amycolatopsis xylanica]|uniref:Putative acetyltransferase n=1 Tax=Amycolatopsis xylanica TaxID=589385 RepID=A0A1H3E4B3_9PSEU|nr:N-acetyltransferase [Amycolatopsis xylanica]SDX73460.1 putative acetyltransferase [Amycolatopsis xylanica]
MFLRRETTADAPALHAVHSAAFNGTVEPNLVDELRAEGDLLNPLSLVAVIDGEIVGHVAGSRATLNGDKGIAVGVGPLGVLPSAQREGVGSALMHAFNAAADALGYGVAVLLGDPKYYSRFGYVLSSVHGIVPPQAEWAQHFQVRTLAGYNSDMRGNFRYAPAFERL